VAGGQITFTNSGASTIQIYSAPPQTHTNNPQLNVGPVSPGSNVTITLTTRGTWQYQNEAMPTQTGTVIVQ
jgi:hypothetical protein